MRRIDCAASRRLADWLINKYEGGLYSSRDSGDPEDVLQFKAECRTFIPGAIDWGDSPKQTGSHRDRAAQLQPIRLHSNLKGENYSGFDADSRRRDARLLFRFNRRPDSQAGRRGFDPRLPLFSFQLVAIAARDRYGQMRRLTG